MFYKNVFDETDQGSKVENSTLKAESFADSLTNSVNEDKSDKSDFFSEDKEIDFFIDFNNEIDDLKFEFLPTTLNFEEESKASSIFEND